MAELITGYGVSQEEEMVVEHLTVSQYLTFQIADELFAVGILDIKEIIEVSQMTPVPMMPDFIRGVINLRGKVVPVVDLAARMQKGKSALSKRSCIVLVEVTGTADQPQSVGMLVDSVNEIVEMEQSHIQPPPVMGEGIDTSFIKAMGRIEETFFILLDVDQILSKDEVMQIEQLKQHHQVTSTPTVEKSDTE